ncbi:MAG: YlbF family regulator [Candidatus Izemoplasmatales bacterium]
MTGERLVAMIRASDLVKRLREIAAALSSDARAMARYGAILDHQKQLVNAISAGRSKRAEALRIEHEAMLSALVDEPLVAEYLALVEELDDVAQEVAAILNEGVAQ